MSITAQMSGEGVVAGNILRWPDGTIYRITRSTQETDGAYVEMEWELPPHGWAPAPHVHPVQTEEYHIIEGALEVRLGNEWRILKAQDSETVPRGTVHTFRVGASGAKVRNVHRPALDFEPNIRMLSATSNARRLGNMRGLRALLYTCLILRRYPRSSRAPNALLNAAVRVFAAVARLLGMRPVEA